jgi:hypothetical protein
MWYTIYMARLNLVKGEFKGTLGKFVGTKYKGIAVIKSAPFGVAPPTLSQTANVRAFEKLNRLAVAMAKAFWPKLGLSDKKMLKHNATAQWLKPLIASHQFETLGFLDVVKESSLFTMTTSGEPDEHNEIRVDFQSSYWDIYTNNARINAITVDDMGYCGENITLAAENDYTYITAPRNPQGKISILAFVTDKKDKVFETSWGHVTQLLTSQGIMSILDTKTGQTNKTLSPGFNANIDGLAIQITGTAPQIGLYFEDEGADITRVPINGLLENSRNKIRLLVPNLSAGYYYIYIKTTYNLDGTQSPDIKTLRLDIRLLVV